MINYLLTADADRSKFVAIGGRYEFKKVESIKAYQSPEAADILCLLTVRIADTVNQEEKHGIQVYIGNETQVQSLRDCSIVTATYELKEGGTGTVGIIGPKRMDYRKVVNTLRNLTDDLDEIFNNKS